MPAFELADPNSHPVRSDDLRGKVVVVRFWATW
jgi:peroxiredoxin